MKEGTRRGREWVGGDERLPKKVGGLWRWFRERAGRQRRKRRDIEGRRHFWRACPKPPCLALPCEEVVWDWSSLKGDFFGSCGSGSALIMQPAGRAVKVDRERTQ